MPRFVLRDGNWSSENRNLEPDEHHSLTRQLLLQQFVEVPDFGFAIVGENDLFGLDRFHALLNVREIHDILIKHFCQHPLFRCFDIVIVKIDPMDFGRLATLFSARNYFAGEHNDSALLLVAPDEQGSLRVRTKRLQPRLDAA